MVMESDKKTNKKTFKLTFYYVKRNNLYLILLIFLILPIVR